MITPAVAAKPKNKKPPAVFQNPDSPYLNYLAAELARRAFSPVFPCAICLLSI
jgi:hypothetical protein